jgi:hypothetical protein
MDWPTTLAHFTNWAENEQRIAQFVKWASVVAQFIKWAREVAQFMKWAISRMGCNIYMVPF